MPRTTEGHIYTNGTHHDGLETDAVLSSTSQVRRHYDVIIIGAGFAGLVAARDITRDSCLSVLLIEARDRIGGRTWTAKALGEEFEMGGTWLHWSQPHIYAEASRYGLHTALKTSAGTAEMQHMLYKPRGEAVESIDIAEADDKLERIALHFFTVDGKTARELMPWPHEPFRKPVQHWQRYDYLSVRDRLDQLDMPVEDKDQLEAHFNSLGSGTGQDTAFITALNWYVLAGYSMQAMYEAVGVYKLGKGGMTSLARHILADYRGDILLRSKVEAIKQHSTGVSISCEHGKELIAKRAICTIPLNCLADIRFIPPLSPLRQAAVQHPHKNNGAKIHYSIKETQAGWFANTTDAAESDLIFAFSDHNGTNTEPRPGTFAIGFGYNGRLKDPRDHNSIVAALKKLKPDATVQGYLTHDWASDPFSKGTWYCASPGMTTKYQQELQKPHGKVIFASADWADGWRGFVDGAIEQGARAAVNVAKALQKGNVVDSTKL